MLSILITLYRTFFYVISLFVVGPDITGRSEVFDTDLETAALIVKLTHSDLADGHSPADRLTLDEELVHNLQVAEYSNIALQFAQDAQLAKSIGDALVTAEEAAREDRIAAELLSRGEPLPVPKSCQTRLEDPAFVMDAMSSDHAIVGNEMHGESSIAGPSAKKWVKCVSCGYSCRDHETLYTPCGHYFCGDCLTALVEAFTRNESLFPLRCCKDDSDPISIEEVLPNLSLELRTLFQQKHEEFSILPKNRVYCSNSTCSSFLGSSEDLVSKIECPSCLVNTCPQCKELDHPGEGCEVNASNKALQELAKRKKWQTCPGCHALVELSTGCYHMTCRCKAHFCYLCAARWKTCACVNWNERRL